MSRRRIRNEEMEEALMAGNTITYRSSGNSLAPLIWSGQVCVLMPVTWAEQVKVNCIVFCKVFWNVQDSGEHYTHKVLSKKWDRARREYYYWIGNNKGHKNGWCYLEHIFGKVVDIYDDRE